MNDDDIIGQISNFTALLNILLIVFISLFIALMILSVLYFAKPLQNIFNRLYNSKEDSPGIRGNVIEQIYYKIDVISRYNLLINSKLSNWEPVLKTNLLGRLLKGEFLKNEEKNIIVSLFGADKRESSWQVAVIGMVGKSAYDDSIKTTEINDIVWRYMPDAIIYMVKSTYFAILAKIESGEGDKSSIETQFEKKCLFILNELNQKYNQFYAIGIGNRYTDIFDVHYSFNEAKRAFREAYIWKYSNIIHFNNINNYLFNYEMPYTNLEKIYNTLMMGDSEQACKLLDNVINDYILIHARNCNKQCYYISKQFYNEVLGVLLRISSHVDLSPAISDLMEYDDSISVLDMTNIFKPAFDFAAEAVKSQSNISTYDLYLSILDFIKENYYNSELSLKMISQKYSLSESYISQCFKNGAGVNLSKYLEELRLAKAERMLLESDMSVQEIAQSVGYYTPNTFYKAFKRKHGIRPSDWVHLQKNNLQNV